MYRQLPIAKMAGTVLAYLQVREEYSDYHSCIVHPQLHRPASA